MTARKPDSGKQIDTVPIGRYLLDRLHEAGVNHLFGIPGDYALGFYDELTRHAIRHIGTTREDSAAFAADGYARCSGLGALAVTYGVGALNVVNAVAGAYAESSPVVVISGAPGVREQQEDPLLHHRFGPFSFQREIFERITCASVVLSDPVTALRDIDSALASARLHSKPVYIELPRDRVGVEGYRLPVDIRSEETLDVEAVREAVDETLERLGEAQSAVVVAGVEVHRRRLQSPLLALIDGTGLPVAATLTGKSVIAEVHPAYLGIYEGAMSTETARSAVEAADLVLMFGVTLNDMDTGIYTARLDPARIVRAALGEVMIGHHRYTGVPLGAYLEGLLRRMPPRRGRSPERAPGTESGFPRRDSPMTVARLIRRLDAALGPEMMVICDTGDCLFASVDLHVHQETEFIATAFYTTMGFAVPAALGAQLARRDRRALVMVGDGAFQMSGTELATHAALGLAPIVVIMNNAGYTTERFLLEGPFNDIPSWRYHRLGEVFGPLAGFEAGTEEEFESALTGALGVTGRPSVINVHLAPDDTSSALRRLTEHMSSRIGG